MQLLFGVLFIGGLVAFSIGFWTLAEKISNHKIDE